MKKILIIISIGFLSSTSSAQQDPMYTQFFSNKIVVNPAYAGTRNAVSLVGLYRNQWTGFDGAPKTTTLSLHAPIRSWNSGIGLSLIYDQIGIQRSYDVKLAYAYHLKTSIGTLSFGLDGQIKKQDMLWNKSNPLETGDNEIPYGQNVLTLPNFGFGIYLFKENYYVGLSAPKLLENETNYNVVGESFQRRHFFAMAGVLIPVSDVFQIKPAVLTKYEMNSPLELDLNVMGIFNKQFWVGGTYRTNDSFDVIVQYHMGNNLRIGYAYDFTLTKLSRVNNGSHEIMIGYDFNQKKKGVYHPRYF
jgi:type IX secretion system PorP/SprF family membrane protein